MRTAIMSFATCSPKGTVVARRSVADLIAGILRDPQLHSGANLGVVKPGSDVDKPYFM